MEVQEFLTHEEVSGRDVGSWVVGGHSKTVPARLLIAGLAGERGRRPLLRAADDGLAVELQFQFAGLAVQSDRRYRSKPASSRGCNPYIALRRRWLSTRQRNLNILRRILREFGIMIQSSPAAPTAARSLYTSPECRAVARS